MTKQIDGLQKPWLLKVDEGIVLDRQVSFVDVSYQQQASTGSCCEVPILSFLVDSLHKEGTNIDDLLVYVGDAAKYHAIDALDDQHTILEIHDLPGIEVLDVGSKVQSGYLAYDNELAYGLGELHHVDTVVLGHSDEQPLSRKGYVRDAVVEGQGWLHCSSWLFLPKERDVGGLQLSRLVLVDVSKCRQC